MKYLDLLKECGFEKPHNTCINIRTRNFDYTLAFVSFETDEQLGILETDEFGREKLKILNKNFIEAVEIVYSDDIDILKDAGEKNSDKMFG